MNSARLGLCLVAVLGGAGFAVRSAGTAAKPATRVSPASPSRSTALAASPRRPAVEFVPDRDETSPGLRFGARGRGGVSFVSATELVLAAPKSPTGAVRVEFLGARADAGLQGESPLPWRTNLFLGDDPSLWRRGVRTYEAVLARGVWPGVDVRWYAGGENLEFDLIVAPGADPSCIAFGVSCVAADGHAAARLDDGGDLVVSMQGGEARLRRPVAYERHGDARVAVDGRFVVGAADALGRVSVTFALGAHDAEAVPLVIDPVVLQQAVIGGSGNDQAAAIAAHPSGHGAYLLSQTDSWQGWFPAEAPLGGTATGGGSDGVVVQVADDGSILGQAVFGSSSLDLPRGIAVGETGDVFVSGSTFGNDFPVTAGTARGPGHASGGVVALRLTSALDLVAATVFAGNGSDIGKRLALGPGDAVYVVGNSSSSNFPTTAGAYRPTKVASSEAFLCEFNATLTSVAALTYLGEGGADSVAVLADGDLGIAGDAQPAFPVLNAAQPVHGGSVESFVLKISPDAKTLRFASFVGGGGVEFAGGIAAVPAGANWPGAAGGLVVCGTTDSASVLGAARVTHADNEVWTAWFRADGALSSVTFLGGVSNEIAGGVVATKNAAYVLAYTSSFGDIPLFPGTSGGTGGGTSDLVVWARAPRTDGQFDVSASGRIGGGGFEVAAGIAMTVPVATKAAKSSPKLSVGVVDFPGRIDDEAAAEMQLLYTADLSGTYGVGFLSIHGVPPVLDGGDVGFSVKHGTLALVAQHGPNVLELFFGPDSVVHVRGEDGSTIGGLASQEIPDPITSVTMDFKDGGGAISVSGADLKLLSIRGSGGRVDVNAVDSLMDRMSIDMRRRAFESSPLVDASVTLTRVTAARFDVAMGPGTLEFDAFDSPLGRFAIRSQGSVDAAFTHGVGNLAPSVTGPFSVVFGGSATPDLVIDGLDCGGPCTITDHAPGIGTIGLSGDTFRGPFVLNTSGTDCAVALDGCTFDDECIVNGKKGKNDAIDVGGGTTFKKTPCGKALEIGGGKAATIADPSAGAVLSVEILTGIGTFTSTNPFSTFTCKGKVTKHPDGSFGFKCKGDGIKVTAIFNDQSGLPDSATIKSPGFNQVIVAPE